MAGMNFRSAYGVGPDDDGGTDGGLLGMLQRVMQDQGTWPLGAAHTPMPVGTSGYDASEYESPQGGLLGRLLALQAEQSQYNGQGQTGIAGADPQIAPRYGRSAPAAQAPVVHPGQSSMPADAFAPSRQPSSNQYNPSEQRFDSPYSPFDPNNYGSQDAGGLLGIMRAMVQDGDAPSTSGSGSGSEFDAATYHDERNGLVDRLNTLLQQQTAYRPQKPIMDPRKFELAQGITRVSQNLGINPQDLATAISYETAGTFDPWKAGPTTRYGQHRGLIQWGEPQARYYGVTKKSSITQQLQAVERYLRDNGVRPNMGLLDIYSAINAGHVGRDGRSDENNGGAPGTVAEKVNTQMADHRVKAAMLLNRYQQTIADEPGISTPAVFPNQAAPIFP